MEFKAAIVFLFLYYIRPQDWVGGLAGFNIIRPMVLVWAAMLFSSRERSLIPGIFKTPHDWMMLAYFGWVVWTAQDAQNALTGFFPLVVFYAFTVHSLTSWERIVKYLKAWNFMLLGVAAIAVASLMKLDFTGAVDLTIKNEGRLCIGTWMHNNPNALGHSLAVVMPLSYLLYFWRGGAVGRFFIFPLQTGLALWCIYETQSKGAFVVSGGLMVLLFVIGRPLMVKIFALTVAFTLGVSALSFLPRMSTMGSLRAEPGVQGRLMAWELAKTAMEQKPAGWKQFTAYINWYGLTERKATHSSYVQVGADLGIVGMCLYLLVLWTAFRSALHAFKSCQDDDERERCRRALMLLIVAYVTSGWMINREYHTEYFLLVAIAAAIHRLCLAENLHETLEEEKDGGSLAEHHSWAAHPQPVQRASIWAVGAPIAKTLTVMSKEEKPAQTVKEPPLHQVAMAVDSFSGWSSKEPVVDQTTEPASKKLWNRVGILDVATAVTLTWVVIYIWEYILKNL